MHRQKLRHTIQSEVILHDTATRNEYIKRERQLLRDLCNGITYHKLFQDWLAVGHPVRLLELGMTNPAESLGPLTRVRIFPCYTMLRRLLKSRIALSARPISVAAFGADIRLLPTLLPNFASMAWIRPNFNYHPRLLAHGYSRSGGHLFRLSCAAD